jgi:hypothetical protein
MCGLDCLLVSMGWVFHLGLSEGWEEICDLFSLGRGFSGGGGVEKVPVFLRWLGVRKSLEG